MPTRKNNLSGRFRYIPHDIGKATSLIHLICIHSIIWWYTKNGQIEPTFLPFPEPISDLLVKEFYFGGMFFAAMTGCSLRFRLIPHWDPRTLSLRKAPSSFVGHEFVRGIIIFILGYLNNHIIWEVLQFTGLAIILILFTLRTANIYVLSAMGILTLGAPYISFLSGPWQSNYYFYTVFGGNLEPKFWPFAPWLVGIIVGFIGAQGILTWGYTKPNFLRFVGVTSGTACLLLGYFFQTYTDFFPKTSASLPSFLNWIGLYLLLSFIWDLLFRNTSLKYYNLFLVYSRSLLMIFFFHYAIFGWIIRSVRSIEHPGWVAFLIFAQIVLGYCLGLLVILLKDKKLNTFMNELPSPLRKILSIPVTLYRLLVRDLSKT